MRCQRGFTYLAVLAALFLVALSSLGVMTYVSQQAQREREAELLRAGKAYVEAIAAYYQATPGTVKRWPAELKDLLEDKRLVHTTRHLRELYPDPISRSGDWVLVEATDGGIAGVRSRSMAEPVRTGPMDLGVVQLPAARRYTDWVFVYRPDAARAAEVRSR